MIKKELNIFFTALVFYSRIPGPKNIHHSDQVLNSATRYFPVIGWIVGAIVTLVYWLSGFIFPESIAIIFSIVAGIITTGAFHEDGFADSCDGFGGGWTVESRLSIMKDSRLGTYGATGLLFMLLTKFFFLLELSVYHIIPIYIMAHSFSRFIPVITIFTGTYARADASSKVKPIGKRIKFGEFVFAFCCSLMPILLFNSFWFLLVIPLPILSGLLLTRYFEKRIGGYTGDCLGAIQQVAEIAIYLSFYLIYTQIHL